MSALSLIPTMLGGVILGFGFGFLVHSECFPQPGIEFDAAINEIVSDTEVFWCADVNGHTIMCRDLRVDSHEKYGVLGGNPTSGILHVTVPSLHSLPNGDISVSRCYIHRVEG